MSSTRSEFLLFCAASSLVFASANLSYAQSLQATIGMPAPLTGPEATFGDAMVKGAQIAIDQAKDIKLKLNVQDDACDPQAGLNAVNKLITDKVDVIVGFHCSGAAMPSLPAIHRAGIPTVVSQALHPAITEQGFAEVFRTISTSAQEAPAAAKILADEWGSKSFALVHDNTAIQKNLSQMTAVALKSRGGDVRYETAFTPHTTEFGVTVAKIMSLNPDSVFLVLYYPEAAQMTKQLFAAGYKGKILECDAGVDPGFIKIAGEDIAKQVSFVTQPITSQFPAAKPFIDAYQAKYNEKPGVLSAYTYDAMNVAIAAIKKAASVEPAKIISALKSYSGDGVTGKIEFDEKGQLKSGVFVRLVVKDGDFVEP
jgi:branched-chain amino acid transport system substrate-binding protein